MERILLSILLGVAACASTCACRFLKSDRIATGVPEGYCRVIGQVNEPGLIQCRESKKTLCALISEAGGLTDFAYTKKILVIHAGVTNAFDYKIVSRGVAEDPFVKCGSTIIIQRIAGY